MSARQMSAICECEGLTKRYGAVEAVRGIGFDVREGEIFGLIGPDGAGKTSTFQILAGVMEATGGKAEVFGAPAREARSQDRLSDAVVQPVSGSDGGREHPLYRRSAARAAAGDRGAWASLSLDVRHGPLHRAAGRSALRRDEAEAGAGVRAGGATEGAAAR